jgi:GTPase SAR1 family protein
MRVSSHINEDRSKRNFEEIIEPWYVASWISKDYGIDALVEITTQSNFKNDSFRNESKFFGVQLKSTESIKIFEKNIHFSISTNKIIQWYNSNLPVLFVINDLVNKAFFYIWIDENLITELNKESSWTSQKSKTLLIPKTNTLVRGQLETIREYVFNSKSSTKKLILPETYFEIKNSCLERISNLEKITEPFNFETNEYGSPELYKKLEESIYRIAISGPSRVGKSSLINALLKKELSPVGFFQTTGVPIQIISNKKEKLIIHYLDNRKEEYPLKANIIQKFASQDENEDNYKEVKLVIIQSANRQLEKGFAIYDIPGLDEPNELIYDYAWQTASTSNIILFLLDASPAQNGGFILRKDIKKQLSELGTSADKIFLVFNKVDSLDSNILESLKKRVQSDLNKFELKSQISDKIYYISTKNQPKKNDNYDSLQSLENELWSFILNSNRNGLMNLNALCDDILNATRSFEEILRSKLFDDKKRSEVMGMITEVQQRIPNLYTILSIQKNDNIKQLNLQIDNDKTEILRTLENDLHKISLADNLPNETKIKDFLRYRINNLLETYNLAHQHHINNLKNIADEWIETNMKQIREYIYHYTQQQMIDLSEIERFNMPSIDYTSIVGTTVFTGIIGALIAPIGFVAAALSGLLGNLIFTAENRRTTRIKKIVNETENRIEKIFPQIKIAFNNAIENKTSEIYSYTHRKLNAYTLDLQNQMKDLGNPITDSDKEMYKNTFEELEKLNSDTMKLKRLLSEYTGIMI